MRGIHMLCVGVALAMAVPALAGAQGEVTPPNNQAGASANEATSTPPMGEANAYTPSRTVSADQIPPAQAQALAQGDNKLVTNGPVPDTAANRAKFGQPLSHTGRSTAPAGN